jgi:hypothetical protein
MTEVALSGEGGNIGQVLRPALLERGVDLRSAGGRRPVTPLDPVARRFQGGGSVTSDLTPADQHPRAPRGGR